MTTTATSLIERSISHTEIAKAEWTGDLYGDLLVECADWTSFDDGGGETFDFWGTTDDGAEWRVYLTPESEQPQSEPVSRTQEQLDIERADYDVYF